MLSHTLELESYLRTYGKDPALIPPAMEMIERANEKFRDGCYPLMGADQLVKDEIAHLFAEALEIRDPIITYVSVDEIGAPDKRKQQMEFFELVAERPLAKLLPVRRFQQTHTARHRGRDLYNLVRSGIGTHRLQPALDQSFGNAFARIIKHNIIAAWYCYCCAVLEGDKTRASRLGKFSEIITKTMPMAQMAEPPHAWIFFVH